MMPVNEHAEAGTARIFGLKVTANIANDPAEFAAKLVGSRGRRPAPLTVG
jgi:hypothetical protein